MDDRTQDLETDPFDLLPAAVGAAMFVLGVWALASHASPNIPPTPPRNPLYTGNIYVYPPVQPSEGRLEYAALPDQAPSLRSAQVPREVVDEEVTSFAGGNPSPMPAPSVLERGWLQPMPETRWASRASRAGRLWGVACHGRDRNCRTDSKGRVWWKKKGRRK